MRKKLNVLIFVLSLLLVVSLAVVAFGCEKDKEDSKPAPTSIEIINEDLTPSPGFMDIQVRILPEGADQSFTSRLVGEHTMVAIADNEVAIDSEIEDGYKFTVEVASVADPSVKASKEFTVDNRPADGLYITTVQRVVDAQYNDGKLQLKYTIMPEAEVTFSLAEEADGVTITAGGEISVDKFANNGTPFTVVATSGDLTASVDMTVLNEIEREISTEDELRAIWTGNNAASLARMQNHYILTNDIALTSAWSGIAADGTSGGTGAQFNGSFNGNGYTISNLNMNAGWNGGFFYSIGENGVVKELTLESGNAEGDGMTGMYCGPFAGYCFGTIENCVANVRVTSAKNSAGYHMPVGSFVGTIGVTGRIRNCISLGQTVIDQSTDPEANRAEYATGFVASVPGTLARCVVSSYALEGTVQYINGHRESGAAAGEEGMNVILSAAEMKSAASYPDVDPETGEGFDKEIWRIVDGALPCLRNDAFSEPASITLSFGKEEVTGDTFTVAHGTYTVSAVFKDADGSTQGVPQSFELTSFTLGDGVAEGAFLFSGNTLTVDGNIAQDGDTCTAVFTSMYSPSVSKTVTISFKGELSVIFEGISSVEYTEEGPNTFDLSQYVSILSGSGNETVTYAITSATPGVSLEGSILTLTAESNNTAVVGLTVTVQDGDDVATSDELSVTIVNTVPKEIGTKDEFLAIWTGDNELSRLHMNNNYILTASIDLGSNAKMIGIGDVSGYCGYSGTFDGNGYTISWTNTVSVGWNSGLFARVNETGVIKNLSMKGAISGAIAGPIGLVYGRVENCFFDVDVTATSPAQTYGTAVAAVCAQGVIRNLIAVGTVSGLTTGTSAVYGKEHDTDVYTPTVENVYALAGTVTDDVNVLTEDEMKTASTFSGWDTDIWYFADGVMPTLKNPSFVVPQSISITNEITEVSAGQTAIMASVSPAGEWYIKSFETTDPDNITCSGKMVTVGASAATNSTFTVVVAAVLAPSVTDEMTFTVKNAELAAQFTGAPDEMDYEKSSTLPLGDYLVVNRDSGYEVVYSLAESVEGVSVDSSTGTVTLLASVNNTATFTVIAAVSDDGGDASASVTISVVNKIFREINDVQDLQNIWTGDNAESRQRLTNNYILKDDIDLTNVSFKMIGTNGGTDIEPAGLSGIFDGNGYTISGIKMDTGWNGGLFARIEATGVVRNLTLISGKADGDGVGSIYGGPLTGYLYGTVENCFVDVRSYSSHTVQPIGNLLGTLVNDEQKNIKGIIKNCIAIGEAVFTGDRSEAVHGSGLVATGSASQIIDSFALSTAVDGFQGYSKSPDENILKSEAELKTASTYSGWDTSIWNITEGEYPSLIKGCSENA